MNKKEFKKQFDERQQQTQLESLDANKNRAQAVSIGMSGSGTTEITMRGQDGTFLWNCYQPVQVTEFIHQLAASIGCHIHIQPRKDFASWREWREPSEQEKLHLNGFPPFAEEMLDSTKIGLAPRPQKQNSFTENENVATKKAVNKRSTKRTRSSPK
tara:strand:- start:1105 stop:1575 length:471 start_codon:yes stop_codon:yes gene_type:complete